MSDAASKDQLLWRVSESRRRLDAAREEFEQVVVEARKAGVALRPLAAASKLSHTGVAKLTDRVTSDDATSSATSSESSDGDNPPPTPPVPPVQPSW